MADKIEKYKTVEKPAEAYLNVNRSKFYSFIYPINSQQEVKQILAQLHKRFHDATHIVYAYVLGQNAEQSYASDAGEPAGSSGPPVLRTIKSYGLTNVMVAVIRYFGGKKLGIPGLIKAYSEAAKLAIENAQIVQRIIGTKLSIKCDYSQVNIVMAKISSFKAQILSQDFGVDCKLDVFVPKVFLDDFINTFKDTTVEIKIHS